MKIFIPKLALVAISGLTCFSAQAIDVADLSLKPSQQCKAPPKAPPYKLMHQEYRAANTPTNAPFSSGIDINGDGWCDWVSTAAMPPHRGDLDEPSMKYFMFLGTKTGWRSFGNEQKFHSDPNAISFSRPLLFVGSSAASFIAPTVVYSRKTPIPYVAAISLNEDILDPNLDSVLVYQWDDSFDALRQVSDEDRKTVVQFLHDVNCKPGRKYGNQITVAQAICGKQPELVK